jgi:hypothetical protein
MDKDRAGTVCRQRLVLFPVVLYLMNATIRVFYQFAHGVVRLMLRSL